VDPVTDPTPEPYTPSGQPNEPIGLFGCTVRDVATLVRNTTLHVQAAGERDPDLSMTVGEVTAWIAQLSDTLTARLVGFERLNDGPRRTTVLGAGRTAVAAGAASYVLAAAHPEFASPAEATSYAQVLWQRWLTGCDQLAATLQAILDGGGDDVDLPPADTGMVGWSFPPPALPDDKRW